MPGGESSVFLRMIASKSAPAFSSLRSCVASSLASSFVRLIGLPGTDPLNPIRQCCTVMCDGSGCLTFSSDVAATAVVEASGSAAFVAADSSDFFGVSAELGALVVGAVGLDVVASQPANPSTTKGSEQTSRNFFTI
jgi:hypothetical protein